MKFGNGLSSLTIVAFSALMVGCASGPKKPEIALFTDAEQSAKMLATESFLPYLSLDDETGKRQAYAPMANPYLNEKGQLDKSVVSLFIKAKQALKNRQLTLAASTLETLTNQAPELSGPWVLKGDLAKLQDQPEQAVEHYAKAIEINKNNVNAYLKLAKVQRLLGRFLHAQNTYTKALTLWKDFPEAHLNLAVLYDLYLNRPFLAQKHMEAYLLLAHSANPKAKVWAQELQQRNGRENYIEQDIAAKERAFQMQIAKEKGATTESGEVR